MLKRRALRVSILTAVASVAIPLYMISVVFPYEMGDGPIPREYPRGSARALLASACGTSLLPAIGIMRAVTPRDWQYISPPNDNPYIRVPVSEAVFFLANA